MNFLFVCVFHTILVQIKCGSRRFCDTKQNDYFKESCGTDAHLKLSSEYNPDNFYENLRILKQKQIVLSLQEAIFT